MSTRAVLFDFDGVIADTENVHIAAWQRTFGALGWDEPEDVCARSMEVEDRQFLAEVFARRKVEGGDVEGWVRRKQDLTLRLLGDFPRIYPGVAALVQHLNKKVQLAVVSTTWQANVEAVLRSAGLLDAFPVIIAKADVAAPKPDPEGYRLALARLGVAPNEAVALEDSPTGLAAARAAGLRAIAVGHRRPMGDWTGDAGFVPDFHDLSSVLKSLEIADR